MNGEAIWNVTVHNPLLPHSHQLTVATHLSTSAEISRFTEDSFHESPEDGGGGGEFDRHVNSPTTFDEMAEKPPVEANSVDKPIHAPPFAGWSLPCRIYGDGGSLVLYLQ